MHTTKGDIPAIVFDDGGGVLGTITHTRPAFEVRTGAITNLERLSLMLDLNVLALRVPELLATAARERHSISINAPCPDFNTVASVLLVNGRCVLPPCVDGVTFASLPPSTAVVDSAGTLLAARVDTPTAARFLAGGPVSPQTTVRATKSFLLDRPWHVRTHRDAALAEDLRELPERMVGGGHASRATVIGDGRLVIHPSATISPGAILDVEHGSIVIDEHAAVRPGAIVIGPAFIGAHATVNEHAVIRGQTSIGPGCKVGGEVGGTIFQGYSNKGHDGYLGDSYVGEWVNLGAGTTNSNLLNTYGEIIAKATPSTSNERTGLQFLGCVLGDHVKTAIGTRIMTGAVVGTGTMWAASEPVSGCVGAFTWRTDAGSKPYRFEKFMEVARAMMSRRGVTPSEAYMELLRGCCTSLR